MPGMDDDPLFIDGCRTPFQRAGTGFRDLTSYQLAAAAIGGLLHRTGLDGVLAHLPELPADRLNLWGGSLALGNPFAPNGARLVTTAVHRLRAEGGRWALVATCAGGALGHAMVLERIGSRR